MQPMVRVLIALLLTWSAGASAASKAVIDAGVQDAVESFRAESPAAAELMDKAEGVLVFPNVAKMGFGIGGEYGEGVLLIDGESRTYYATTSASFGLQLGMQFKAQIILFMEEQSLYRFQRSKGWEVGVDGSVALVQIGAGGAIDTETVQQPIIGFIFSNKGLMYNLTLEGSKITPIER